MYSKELEEIIDAALADGEITDKERAVLHKRAIAEGVDPDELDVVIEGRLAKMQKVEKDWLRPMPPQQVKSDKYGEVRKCPQCGAVVEAGSVKCSDCGYTFRGIEANSSRQKLTAILEEIENRDYSAKSTIGKFLGNLSADSDREAAMARAINNFPIPTAKEDLLEFILFLEPHVKSAGILDRYRAQITKDANRFTQAAYKAKYEECIKKAKVFFSDDPQFKAVLSEEKKKGLGGLFRNR